MPVAVALLLSLALAAGDERPEPFLGARRSLVEPLLAVPDAPSAVAPTAMAVAPAVGGEGAWLVDLPAELLQGQEVTLAWRGTPAAWRVTLGLVAGKIPVGGRSLGTFVDTLAAWAPGQAGQVTWRVPWLDAIRVRLELRVFDEQGQPLAGDAVELPYRPASLADRRDDGIYVDLHSTRGQRLFLQRGGVIEFATFCSGALGARVSPIGRHPGFPHDHLGSFTVGRKVLDTWSSIDRSRLRCCLFYHNGHAIHATTEDQYPYLGAPRSHGCIRLHLVEAQWLYQTVGTGMRIVVF